MGDMDEKLILKNVQTGKSVWEVDHPADGGESETFTSVAISPTGELVIAGDGIDTIRI